VGFNDVSDLDIERTIVIDAPIAVVWRTITEPDQVARWFADRVELDARPGANGTLFFDQNKHTAPLVVERVEPPTLFSFRWCHPDGEQPVSGNSTLVEFTLVGEGEARTTLTVTEKGLDAMPLPDDEKQRFAESHGDGWKDCFERLGRLFSE
jgi:uncharacterized protein YndB with AHSA1/START domain